MNKRFLNVNHNDNIGKYFSEIKNSKILSLKEERELFKKIKDGSESSKTKIIECNLKFVVSIAKQYQGAGLPISDLINEGNIGLITAVDKFDLDMNIKFITYAVFWIRSSILKALSEHSRTIRLPISMMQKLTDLKKEINTFELSNGREPSYNELITSDSIKLHKSMNLPEFSYCKSLNEVIGETGEELGEFIQNDIVEESHYNVTDKVKTTLNDLLSELPIRESDIIKAYFGLDSDCEPMTLEAIGDKFQLTKERVRQIKNKTLRKLKHNSNELFMVLNE